MWSPHSCREAVSIAGRQPDTTERKPKSGRDARSGREQPDTARRVRTLTNGSRQPAAESHPHRGTRSDGNRRHPGLRGRQPSQIDGARQISQEEGRQRDKFRGGPRRRHRIGTRRFAPRTVRTIIIGCRRSGVGGTAAICRTRGSSRFALAAARPAIDCGDDRGDDQHGRQPTQQHHSQHITHPGILSPILRREAAMREEEFPKSVRASRGSGRRDGAGAPSYERLF